MPYTKHINERVYFDNNAITPMTSVVKEAMIELMDEAYNPSSVHSFGRSARAILDTARARIASAVKASSDYEVVFTASATEANNLAIKGLPDYKLITTVIEHPSVLALAENGGDIPVNKNGLVNLEVLENILATAEDKILVSIQAANSETGVIQPLKEICAIVHKHGAILHVDAVQALGKISFSLSDIKVDIVSISSNKVGGPAGAAALIFKKDVPINPIMQGGGQEFRLRPGTQNVIAIHGFGIATEVAVNNLQPYARLSGLIKHLESEICAISPKVIVFSKEAPRLPNTSAFTMPGVSNEAQVIHFDISGYAVSAGTACSSGKVGLPYVQMAMGYDEDTARSGIRISLNPSNTLEQIKRFIWVWKEMYLKLNKMAA